MNYCNDFLKEIPKGFSKGLLLRAQDHPRFISLHFLTNLNQEVASESSGPSPDSSLKGIER